MKKTFAAVAIVSFICIGVFAYSQIKGIVFSTKPNISIPQAKDTMRVVMLVTDTTANPNTGKFFNQYVFQITGYMVLGGNQWTPKYLNDYKKPLPPSVLVWDAVVR